MILSDWFGRLSRFCSSQGCEMRKQRIGDFFSGVSTNAPSTYLLRTIDMWHLHADLYVEYENSSAIYIDY